MPFPRQPIRILLAIPHLGGGGAERVIALLATHLDPRRFEIHLALVTADAPGAEVLPAHVTLHRLQCTRVRHAALPLLRLIRALRPDAVLSGMAHLNFLFLALKPLLPRRTRILVRQNTTASAAAAHWLTRLAYRRLYPRADRIFCQSQPMADDLTEHFGISPQKLLILRNPIVMPGQSASNSTTSSQNLNLLFIGRLSPEKGPDLLLKAFPQIRAARPQANLVLLGIGPEEPQLRRLAAQLQIAEAVHFAGHADPALYFDRSTLFVLPSRYEGIPNALLEAAAAGLPIVATPASSGLVELLRGAPHCWLASSITPDALARSILEAQSALRATDPTPIHHAFLEPFRLEHAIPAYTQAIEREVRPRLALLIPTLDQIGGAERQLLDLAQQLAPAFQLTVITLSGSDDPTTPAAAQLAQAGIPFLSLQMRKAWIDPRGWLRYLRWHRSHRPEILHAHLPHATFFARLSRLIAPVPVLIDTIHTSATGPLSRRLAYRLTHWLSTQVTCVSQAVAAAVRHSHTAPNPKVLPNGIPIPPTPHRTQHEYPSHSGIGIDGHNQGQRPTSYQPGAPPQRSMQHEVLRAEGLIDYQIPIIPPGARDLASEIGDGKSANHQTPFRWLAVGRLAPVKDYPNLLRAFAQLPGSPTLTIAGSGPSESDLRALAVQLGLAKRIHFAGFQPNIQPLLAAADAFVLASLWEGLPISVLEASAAALPVVATGAAGTREALIPGQTGFLVPIADHGALAAAMTRLQQLPAAERQAMGFAGHAFVQANFSIQQIATRWQQLYLTLLSRR